MIFTAYRIIQTKSNIYVTIIVIVYHYISRWHHDPVSKTIYPELTRYFVSFQPSSTVPVCCIVVDRNVLIGAAEHNKYRIRRNFFFILWGRRNAA
jgi:hypothetical protein